MEDGPILATTSAAFAPVTLANMAVTGIGKSALEIRFMFITAKRYSWARSSIQVPILPHVFAVREPHPRGREWKCPRAHIPQK